MKVKFSLAALMLSSAVFAGDMLITAEQLPQNAKNFLSTHFKTAQIAVATRDMDSFEVRLNNGTEVEFFANGEWESVDGHYMPIPTSYLPNVVVQNASASQKGAAIVEAERKMQGYKLKFNNNMKVYIDNNGQILGQKYD